MLIKGKTLLISLPALLAALSVSAADGRSEGDKGAGNPSSARSFGAQEGYRLAAKAEDNLPDTKDALFGDDDPVAEQEPADAHESSSGDGELAKGESATVRKSPPAAIGFKGFIQNEMAYTTVKPRHWSEMMTRADVSAQGDWGGGVKWKLGARVDYDATYALTDFYPQPVADNQRFNVLLRENYLDVSSGDWDFRLGRQHVVWGEMVGLFFGDVVSARDMRQFILPEFEILRIPQWAARAEYFKNDVHAEFLWIPVATYDEIGKPGGEFFAYTPPGVPTVFRNEKIPSRNLANTNYGLRLSVLRDGWDVAGFAYSSMSVAPTFYRESIVDPRLPLVYQARHDRIHQFGGTVAKDFGAVVVKAEAVYTRGQNYPVKNLTDADGVVPQDTLNWVLGIDYNEITDTRINLQVFQSHFFDHDRDLIQEKNENGYSLLLNRKFGDRVEAQVLWIASLNRNEWLLRPRVSWNFEKNWRLAVGTDIFRGPPLGFFGRFDDKDRVYTELRYSF